MIRRARLKQTGHVVFIFHDRAGVFAHFFKAISTQLDSIIDEFLQ
jgi:hypothetical protein